VGKPRLQISHTPSLATQILEKSFWKENETNQQWSLEKGAFYVL